MKVLLVAASASTSGGGERHVMDLVRLLPEHGVEVVLACPFPGDLPERAIALGIETERLEIARGIRPGQFVTLASIIHDHQPDIVHAHGSRAAFFARLADGRARQRCVYTVHGIHVDKAGSKARRAVFLGLERRLAPRTAAFITVCDSDIAKGERLGIIEAARTTTVYNGIPPASPADPGPFLAEVFADAPRGPLVLSVGRLHEQKDQATLLRAWALVRDRVPGARLALIGDGELANPLLLLAEELGLGDSFALLPPRRDIASAFSACDAFALSSLWEGLPYVVLEAMAHSRPVVSTDVDGIPEAVVDGETGVLVPPSDPAALADGLVRVLTDERLRSEMGRAGRDRVEQEFSLPRMVENILAVYSRLLQTGHS